MGQVNWWQHGFCLDAESAGDRAVAMSGDELDSSFDTVPLAINSLVCSGVHSTSTVLDPKPLGYMWPVVGDDEDDE